MERKERGACRGRREGEATGVVRELGRDQAVTSGEE